MSNSKGKKPKHSQARSSLSFRGITTIPQSFLIWWSGADNKTLPSHARKAYAGLGAMAMVSTILAVLGGYTFVFYSFGSFSGEMLDSLGSLLERKLGTFGAFLGNILGFLRAYFGPMLGAFLAGMFMWGLDRSILGFSSEQKKPKKEGDKKEGDLGKTFDATFWVKILVNVIFSTVLTVPLSTTMLIKAVDNVKANDTANIITEREAKITTQGQRVSDAVKALQDVDKAKYININGKTVINQGWEEKRKEAASRLKEEQKELGILRKQRDNLDREEDKYKRGENTTNLPDQFHIVMTRARWTDSVLGWLFFPITAIMGSGAVLIRTLVFTNDANSKIVQRLEKEAKDQEDLQYMMNTSANHVYSSIFNNDEMSQSLIDNLKDIKDEYERKVERLYKSLYDERLAKIQAEIEKEKSNTVEFSNDQINNNGNSGQSTYRRYQEPHDPLLGNTKTPVIRTGKLEKIPTESVDSDTTAEVESFNDQTNNNGNSGQSTYQRYTKPYDSLLGSTKTPVIRTGKLEKIPTESVDSDTTAKVEFSNDQINHNGNSGQATHYTYQEPDDPWQDDHLNFERKNQQKDHQKNDENRPVTKEELLDLFTQVDKKSNP